MKLLLDTHLLLWASASPERIGAETLAQISDLDNEVTFSAASIWEVAIKSSLGRSDFNADASLLRRALLDNGYLELPVTGVHAAAVASLPAIHRDPFDRILVAQAQTEGILLLTADSCVAQYPGPINLV